MKINLFAIILFLLSINDCSNPVQDSVESISYETFTRGSSTKYELTPSMMQVSSNGIKTFNGSMELSQAQWISLTSKLRKIKVSEINQLKAPSDGRTADAALHAILSIRKNDTLYKTNSFDHGNAPEPIKPLVEAILRLAENVE